MGKITVPRVETTGLVVGLSYKVSFDHTVTPHFGRNVNIYQLKGAIFGMVVRLVNGYNYYYLDRTEGLFLMGYLATSYTLVVNSIKYEAIQNSYCSNDSCRVECIGIPDNFCCIDHSLTDRLKAVLNG